MSESELRHRGGGGGDVKGSESEADKLPRLKRRLITVLLLYGSPEYMLLTLQIAYFKVFLFSFESDMEDKPLVNDNIGKTIGQVSA